MRKLPECDCKYGAPMGRAEKHLELGAAWPGAHFHLRQVPLDSGGYDEGGAYWGARMEREEIRECRPIGSPVPVMRKIRVRDRLWWYYLESMDRERVLISGFIDAVSRDEAKAAIKVRYPGATFFR